MNFRPWLLLPPQLVHDLAPVGLRLASWFYGQSKPPEWQSFQWRDLHFPNRLGIAGGVDKDGQSILPWLRLGVGFVEIGTVTPLPQKSNPGRILARDTRRQIVWNRMGFPSLGAEAVARELARIPRPLAIPLFINIGKNRHTEINQASRDYVTCMEQLNEFADAFVINISSPNTLGLRDLQSEQYFRQFLGETLDGYQKLKKIRPILLKVSPDLTEDELASVLASGKEFGLAGYILTNSTQRRPLPNHFPPQGGFSGLAVQDTSARMLQSCCQILGSSRANHLLVSVGGVMTPQDVQHRLEMGADLVQVYSALIFSGPLFFQKVAQHFSP